MYLYVYIYTYILYMRLSLSQTVFPMWGQEIKLPQGNSDPPAVAAGFPWLSVTSLKTYVWSFNMSTSGRKKKTCCWKKVSWCVTKCIHMMKRDLRTVISNDSLAPPLPFRLILAARFQSFATQRVESLSCASMGFWRKAGSVSNAGPPTQGPCQGFHPGNYLIPSNSISRGDFNPVHAFFEQVTLRGGLRMEWLLSRSLQSRG